MGKLGITWIMKIDNCGGKSHLLHIRKGENSSCWCILDEVGLRRGWQDGDEGNTQTFPAAEVCDCEKPPPRDKTQCLRQERLCVLIWKFPFLHADNILRRVKNRNCHPQPRVIALGTAFLSLQLMEKCTPLIILNPISGVGEGEMHYVGRGRGN